MGMGRGGGGGWVQTVSAKSDTHGCVKLFGLTGELEKVRGYFWLLAEGTIGLLSEAAQRERERAPANGSHDFLIKPGRSRHV